MKAKGRAYENRAVRGIRGALAKQVSSPLRSLRKKGTFYLGQWIQYTDSNKTLNAQPDLYLHFKEIIFLFEFKLTRCQAAEEQLLSLYGPLLFGLFHLPIVFISCFHNPGSDYNPFPTSPRYLSEVLELEEFSFNEWHLRI